MTVRMLPRGAAVADTEIVFTLEPDNRGDRKLALPVGWVNGLEVPGLGKSKAGWLGFGTKRFVAALPRDKAASLLDFHQKYAARVAGKYNCLSFMATLQDWPVGIDELFFDSGPDLAPGRFQEVQDLTNLDSGEPYGLPDDDSQLIHGIVGLGVPDRHIEVDQLGGKVRIAPTTRTVPQYLAGCAMPNRLVHLQSGSYASSELFRPPVPIAPVAAA